MRVKQYKINTLDDILKIPSDKLDLFFEELVPRIKQISETREMMENFLPDGVSVDDVMKLGTMTWVDDGKKEIESTIRVKGSSL